MVERYLFLRLQPAARARRDTLARALKAQLDTLGSTVRLGLPADKHADKAWDLSIAVTLSSVSAADAWAVQAQPVFVALGDQVVVHKGWNMEVLP